MYENLSFRANVIAFLKAMVLYVAHGEQWDKTIEDFVRWSLQYDLWCKMQFFGEAIEAQEYGLKTKKQRGPRNLLDLLPEVFTYEEAGLMRQRQGIWTGTLGKMIFNWKTRGYIELMEGEDTASVSRKYRKTKESLMKHPQSSILN